MTDFFTQLIARFLYPIYGFFAEGEFRYYWVYAISGLCVTFFLAYRRGKLRETASAFFHPQIWFSPSAKIDYWLLTLNSALTYLLGFGILYHILSEFPQSAILAANPSEAPASAWLLSIGAVGLTISLFLAADFMHWFTHYIQHRIPALWEFHKVHHSAEHLNFFTSERFHPVDILVSTVIKALFIGGVNAVFVYFFADALTIHTLFGANILLAIGNIAGGAMRHSPVSYRYGDFWEKYFISPEMHRVHHSENPEHFDKNFGGTLAFWDRIFGTLYIPKDQEKMTYGIGEESAEFRSLSHVYFGPFRNIFKKKPAD